MYGISNLERICLAVQHFKERYYIESHIYPWGSLTPRNKGVPPITRTRTPISDENLRIFERYFRPCFRGPILKVFFHLSCKRKKYISLFRPVSETYPFFSPVDKQNTVLVQNSALLYPFGAASGSNPSSRNSINFPKGIGKT